MSILLLNININQLNVKIMIKFINKSSLKDLISALTFTSRSVRLNGEKISRSALADLCSLLWHELQSHSSVIRGTYKLAPACSWSSLSYSELNCLVRVLLTDYLQLYCVYASRVIDAYIETLPSSPFGSFLTISKVDVELPVSVATIYSYDGKLFYCESDLWDYVHKQYPQSKYNVSLKF